jgi:hypothetical protein
MIALGPWTQPPRSQGAISRKLEKGATTTEPTLLAFICVSLRGKNHDLTVDEEIKAYEVEACQPPEVEGSSSSLPDTVVFAPHQADSAPVL